MQFHLPEKFRILWKASNFVNVCAVCDQWRTRLHNNQNRDVSEKKQFINIDSIVMIRLIESVTNVEYADDDV